MAKLFANSEDPDQMCILSALFASYPLTGLPTTMG